jgi:LPS sulfotransferase NodH
MTAKIIFVLSEARTGSTLLCQLLNHYKNVINFHEIFHDIGGPINNDVFNTDVNFNNVLQDQFGDGVFDREKMFPRIIENPQKLLTLMGEHFTKTLIVKIHLFQLFGTSYPVSHILDWILTQPNHEFILLERNFLNAHVSLLKAEQSDIWHNIDTTNTKVEIDTARFKTELTKFAWKYSTIKNKLQEHGIDYLQVEYDRDLKNYDMAEFEQLIEPWGTRRNVDLGLGNTTWIRVKKQNTDDDISNSISNWQEITTILKG